MLMLPPAAISSPANKHARPRRAARARYCSIGDGSSNLAGGDAHDPAGIDLVAIGGDELETVIAFERVAVEAVLPTRRRHRQAVEVAFGASDFARDHFLFDLLEP